MSRPSSSAKTQSNRWRRRLVVDILTAFTALLVLTVLIIIGYTYRSNSRAVLDVSTDLLDQVSSTVIEKTTNYLMPGSIIVELSARLAEHNALEIDNVETLSRYGLEVLRAYPQLAMFNIGDENGNFLMQKKLYDGSIATKVVNQMVDPPTETWIFRNPQGDILRSEVSNEIEFDPRDRPWYKGAKASGDRFWNDLYIFFTDQKPGITTAYPVSNPDGSFYGVFAADIELSELSNFLRRLKVGNSGQAFIINDKDELVAYPDVSRIVKQESETFRPVHLTEIGAPIVTAAYEARQQETTAPQFVFTYDNERYLAAFTPFPADFGKNWQIVTVVPENDFVGAVKETNEVTVMISLVILLMAVFTAFFISRKISKPIVRLTEETEKIRQFKLDDSVVIRTPIHEIQLISESMDRMRTGLRAFQKYVPAALVRELVETGEDARLGGQIRSLTIMFSDIADFTSISEGISPEELMVHLSDYFEELAQIVRSNSGTIDKYIGDSLMGFWGAPTSNVNHARDACKVALLCLDRLSEMNARWQGEGRIPLPTRFGIHTGETVVGNMGSSERMNYTVIGDSVNLASRLEGVNKMYGTHILISQSTYEQVNDHFVTRPLGIVAVKGKQRGIKIYELVATKTDQLSITIVELCNVFSRGFDAYLAQNWDEAIRTFDDLSNRYPDDKPTRLYASYSRQLRDNPPGAEWDGVIRLTSK